MRARTWIVRAVAFGITVGCASPRPSLSPETGLPPDVRKPARNITLQREPDEVGLASWYGRALAGRRTANGERFDPSLFTAAHKKLPFGTWVEVRRIDTGGTVRVRINDRGPNGRASHRIIDLSQRAAEELGIVRAGVARVELRILGDVR